MSFLIPGFSDPVPPPIGTLQPFTLTDQDGKTVTEKDMAGKVVAVEYFFTTCKGICPRMNANLRPVYEAFKNERNFFIFSHTCDPETDSPAKLKSYADSLQIDTNKWRFVTGRKDSLYHLARHVYKIDDPKNDLVSIEDDFLHTQFIALVNKKGNIVRIYDALKKDEIAGLQQEIGTLLKN